MMAGLSGNILVTGGAGFLARAMYRRAERDGWDCRWTALSRDDAKHAALQKRYPAVQTVVADVGLADVERLTDLMRGYDTVIHAAASKYVDRSEHYVTPTIETNIIGSMKVAEAARRARVERVVGISTDKATAPANTYGLSKMAMERIFQEAARLGETKFTVVRYGNVVGSTGSVIPLFMEWAAEGKPIRLTDPGMTRFWMSADEAVDTVLHGLEAPTGMLVIPACRSMSMHDLTMMALGYEEHAALPADGRVEIIGTRPGEKRHEALVHVQESVRAWRVPPSGNGTIISSGRWRWCYICPPDEPVTNPEPFEVTSDKPPRGWLGPGQMREIIADSEGV